MSVARMIDGAGDVLILCDHASAGVPEGIDLDIAPELLEKHIAVDIGAAAVSEELAAHLGCPAILAEVSRLVIDLNREPDSVGLIPVVSDGHAIPGNRNADRAERIARLHGPYHAVIARNIRARRPELIVSVHSFTPRLELHDGNDRPWQVGILYNRDARAAVPGIAALRAAGVVTGDNEPYSGRILNATMNRHAEANGIPYLGIEIRNDLIREAVGVAQWAQLLASIVKDVRNRLARTGIAAT